MQGVCREGIEGGMQGYVGRGMQGYVGRGGACRGM